MWFGRENDENVVRTRDWCGWPSSPRRPFYEKLDKRTASFFYFLCHAFNIRNQRRFSSRLSIPMFNGTPCI